VGDVVALIERHKIQIVTRQAFGKVIEVVEKAARTGRVGDGKIFVSALDQAVRVRTGETNEAALIAMPAERRWSW
jgi:nitrogen regulatory protein PII